MDHARARQKPFAVIRVTDQSQSVELHWQVAPLDTVFTAASGVISAESAWVDVLSGGVTLTQQVTGLQPETLYHPPAAGRPHRLHADDHGYCCHYLHLRCGQSFDKRQWPGVYLGQ